MWPVSITAHKYPENYKKLPQQIILGSETASTVSSRGVYKFPVVRQAMKKYDDHQSSSYDVEHCGWSNLPEDDWIWHEDNAWGIGEFVWTGFDYLGELLLIIRIGQAIAPCSVLSIWRVSPRIVTIYTVVIGTKAPRPCISCRIGHGRDVRAR